VKQLITEIKQVRETLETKISQLETYVKDKDQVIFGQQQRISELDEAMESLRDEMKAIALAVCRSTIDGESDCDWHDLAGDVNTLRREYDRLCDEARHQGAELCAMREALTAMYVHYGPPVTVDAICPYPAGHPITLARVALGKSV
jgi:chromosome segregation ATPase